MTETRPYRILVTLSEPAALEAWVNFAVHLATESVEVHLRGLVVVPEGVSLSEGAMQARHWRDAFNQVALAHPLIHDETRVYVDHRPMLRILDELPALGVDLFLAQWLGPNMLTGGATTDDILQHIPCDVVLLCGDPWNDSRPVLLSLRGGPNTTLGVRTAKALAGDAAVTLFHAMDRRSSGPDLKVLMQADPQITRTVTAVSGIREGILRETVGHKAVVLGATFHQAAATASTSSPVIQQLREHTPIPMVLVRASTPEPLPFHAPSWPAVVDEPLSRRVDRWFAENTFHSSEFADLHQLLSLKEKQGVTISLGLPALNEEETVGHVIQTLKTALMDDLPLLDEIVLIDSDSTDNTVAIAQDCGIPTYTHPQILPAVGSYRGKGEALWKSLHVLHGDIIVWVDTDITNIHPRFIYGLLGPLLRRTQVQYVKGFYQRPIKVEDKLQAYGGGRVTELVARPLLNLFYPELSGIIQPLSGEYAGRRTALEQLPFFTGYGVETGLLIDMLERFGLEAIAQTDLEVRVHHNQPLVGLSKMSFAILQVFIARLENSYGIQLLERANRSMKLIVHEPERFALEISEIGDLERPPMMSLADYREQHGK
jgi:hypothetical protein